MSKAHFLTIQVCIQRADGTISIYDEFPLMLRYEEEEEYLEALKYRLPLRRFDSGPLCDYECLCDVLNETYREYCHDIDLAPGERLLIRYADKPEDAPLSKKEAAKTIREMFEEAADDDRNFEKIERHCKFQFARCYKGGYPALAKLAAPIAAEYADEDEMLFLFMGVK